MMIIMIPRLSLSSQAALKANYKQLISVGQNRWPSSAAYLSLSLSVNSQCPGDLSTFEKLGICTYNHGILINFR